MKPYNIEDWYWEVADQSPGTQVYSSAAQSYILKTDQTYIDFISDGTSPTKIDSQDLLLDVLIRGYEEGLSDNERLKGIRPRDLIEEMTTPQFVVFRAQLSEKEWTMFLLGDRVDLSTGSPYRDALDATTLRIGAVPKAGPVQKWSNRE